MLSLLRSAGLERENDGGFRWSVAAEKAKMLGHGNGGSASMPGLRIAWHNPISQSAGPIISNRGVVDLSIMHRPLRHAVAGSDAARPGKKLRVLPHPSGAAAAGKKIGRPILARVIPADQERLSAVPVRLLAKCRTGMVARVRSARLSASGGH